MNTCPGCNTTIEHTGAKFCPKCGTPVNNNKYQKPKTTWIIAGVIASVLLIVGIALIIRFLPFLKPAYAATLAPAETDLFFVINPDLKQVKNFNRIKEIYESTPEFKKALDDLQGKLKANSDIDFEKDVKPWLGREAALIVPDAFVANSREPAFLVAVASTNEKKTGDFLEKMRQGEEKRGSAFEEKTYEDVIVTVQKNTSSPLVYAFAKDFLFLSNDEKLVYQTINKTKDKSQQNLSKNENYKEAMGKLPKSRTGALYLDVQDIARAITDGDRQFQQLSQLKAYKGMGISLSFADEGVRFDYALAYDPKKMPAGQDTSQNTSALKKANEIISSDAIAYLGFPKLKNNVENFLNDAKSQPAFADFNEDRYDFERESGISLERDILFWLTGEVAFGVFSERNGFFGERNVPFGVVALFATGDPQAAGSKMRKISDMLASKGLRVYEGTFNSQEIFYLLHPYTGDYVGGYGIRDGYLVVGSSREMLEKAMGANKETLANSTAFKKATDTLPAPQDSLVYLDVEKGINLLNNTMNGYERQEFERNIYPYLKPVKSVSLAAQETNTKDNFVTGAAIIRIDR